MSDLISAVPIRDMVKKMEAWGQGPAEITALLGITEEDYNSVSKTQIKFIPADAELADAIRAMAWRVLGEITRIMNGDPPYTPTDRTQVVKLFIPRLTSLLGAQREIDNGTAESKLAVQRIFEQMQVHKQPPIEPIPSPELQSVTSRVQDPRSIPMMDEEEEWDELA